MHLSQQVFLDCNATYSVAEIGYSNGILEIKADYTTDLEGENCTVTFSFDQQIIQSPTIFFGFQAISDDLPLRVTYHQSQFSLLKTVFLALSLSALGVFALSLPHKMAGAEVLSSCQMVYLSNAFYEKPSFLFSSAH